MSHPPEASLSSPFTHNDASEATVFSDAQQEVTRLARTITGISERQSHYDPTDDSGPFSGDVDPSMDPRSGKFDHHRWMRWMLDLRTRHLGRDSGRTAGISFTNLNVHGYGTPTDYQKTVGNVVWAIPGIIKGLFGFGGQRIDILRNFKGVLKDGEMLIVLGPPGSGCSTFLKTIAGEVNGLAVDENALINYQGIPWEIMHKQFRGEVMYSAETDVHFPHLTVGQTLTFAAKARTPRTRLPGVTREQWATHMKDVVMAVFGLSHTENTKVGNEYVRGVSGGERKRVSIAEVTLGGSPLQCWDNSTRGLDSATALEFVKTLRLSTKYTGSTVALSLYQASQNIYDTFDKVTVLYEGRQIYFGRATEAKAFFVNLGFECPERQTTADFLTSLTNPSERKARPGFEMKVPRTPDEFAKAWEESNDHKALCQEIDEFNRAHPIGGERLEQFRRSMRQSQAKSQRPQSPYIISVPMQIKLCLTRAFQRLRADMSLSLVTILGNFCMGLITSSIFYNLSEDTSSFYSRSALLFYAVLLAAFQSILEILTIYEQRPIVEKHNQMALYHPFCEAIAAMICDLPTKLLTNISFNLVLYFMSNLRREPGAFFLFLLFSFTCTICMSMIFRTIGASTKTIAMAMAPASLIMLALVIYTGFTIPTRDMLSWSRWINYINPIAYVFESLMVNEFNSREFPCTSFFPSGPGYENVTGTQRSCTVTGAEPGSSVVQGTRLLSEAYEYSRSHLWRNYGIVIGYIIFFLATYLLATEFIQGAKSKGEVLVFRRGHVPAPSRRKDDEESSNTTVQEKKSADLDTQNREKSGVIMKQTAIFHWEDVCYDIKIKGEPRRLLDHVDGWVEPGKLTALMGASGAGKTTLLDVLASRVTMGVITGSMFVDGKQRDDSFQRKTGYVQQQDLHLQTSTVREALIFSARLRQPHHVSDKEKVEYVEEVIRLLNMESYADAVVGVPGEGLNVEQRKRLTIGVELAAKPALLLFLDEPTSGLDSQTSWSICTLLRKLADNGQAILCTIHQPSALLFQSFDRLLFLAKGGRTVYFGDIGKDSRTLIDYFERQGADSCPPEANPAEWMLHVIGAAPGAVAKRDYADAWRESPEYTAMKKELVFKKETLAQKEKVEDAEHTEFAAPLYVQLYHCFIRVLEQLWRTPSYIYAKLVLCVLTALFIGFSFFKADNTRQGLQNQMFSIFMLMTIFGNIVNQIMPEFVKQRSLYEVRERPSKTYSWKAFLLANIIAEIAWNTLAAVLTFLCWYYPIGLYRNAQWTDAETERSGLMFLLVWAFFLFTSTFAHLCIAPVDLAETGGNIAQLAFSLMLVFCGVLVPPSSLPGFWMFMYRVSPFTYLIDGIMSTALANAPAFCSDIEFTYVDPPSGLTCGQYLANSTALTTGSLSNPDATSNCQFCSIKDTNSFLSGVASRYDLRWRNFSIMWAYIVFNFFGALFLYWLVRVPKKSKAKKA
ncbi:hypothetical protein L218DRAFT_851868 [Marasmius fiardii PR-910]|nr:hypothetical protein L218DRAFT_851868 [Marasmius fiardii PR-910]